MSKTYNIPSGATQVTIPDPVTTQGTPTFITPVPPPTNHSPIANAGADIQITAPLDSVQLTGSASDPDTGGKVVATNWAIRSGTGVISDPTSLTPMVTGLVVGTTVCRLTATDDLGATGFDDVNIVVNSTTPPPTPGYTPIYTNNISSVNDCDPFNHQQWGASTLASHFDTTNFVSAPGSFRARPANVSSGTRSEIQMDSAQSPTEGAAEWDMKINVPIWQNGHCFQYHPNTTGGSASPGLWFVGNGQWDWHNWIGGINQGHPVNYKVDIGVWHHHRTEWLMGKNGYFRHFIDGNLVCSWTGQVGDNSGFFIKAGYNGWNSDSASFDANYDNIVIFRKN